MAKIDEKVLWGAAVKLRDKCDPADYKNVVLGLVFLKYVSDRYLAKFNELKSIEKFFAVPSILIGAKVCSIPLSKT